MEAGNQRSTPDPAQPARFLERRACVACGSERLAELSRGRYADEPVAGFLDADPGGAATLPHVATAEWVLARCQDCGQVFHRYILDAEWNERRFSEWMSAEAIEAFDERHSGHIPRFARHFQATTAQVGHVLRLERLTRPLRPRGEAVRLLDFGCGWGSFLEVALSFGFDGVGVDRAAPRIEGAKVPVFASLDDLGPREPFHAVTLFEVLEHLDEPAAMLRELARHLMPGGILVLETPDCAGVTDIRDQHHFYKVHPLEHINAFTHATLTAIAERCGFRPVTRGPAYVLADYGRVAKRTLRHALGRDQRSTQLYFRKG